MRPIDVIRLVTLAAIWGSAFIFMRMAAPVLGAVPTAAYRVALAGVVLFLYARTLRVDAQWRHNARHYLAIGVLNSGIPFALFSFAAMQVPASLSAVLNSTSPLFGALFAVFWLNEKLTLRKAAGLLLGVAGVVLVAQPRNFPHTGLFAWAVLACLIASMCYGLTGIYMRRVAPALPPVGVAAGSQLGAGVALLPFVPLFAPNAPVTAAVVWSVLALALLCSAIAYLLYFRLMADVGPTRALTVTFLVPVFGLLWGFVFLGERITALMAAGCTLVVAGTWLVARAK
jgi:drug/metabolite transporter (DMT)-like permease